MIFADILTATALFFSSFILIYALWIAGVAVAASLKKSQTYTAVKQHTFAVVICARNEEQTVGDLIESLKKQNYPRELFGIFLVAHNCTDNTADVAAGCGAEVFIRNSEGYKEDALAFGLEKIEEKYPGTYEYFTVFDADSLADVNFLKEMNNSLDATDADCAAGYYNSRNFEKNTVTGLCGMLYHCLMHSSSIANGKLNLPVDVYGSGYSVKMKWRPLVGRLTTLVDDFEFSLLMVLNRAKMIAVPRAVFYAEMPEELGQALYQRKRWSYGDTQCYRKYVRSFRKAIFTHGISALKQYIELIMNPFVSFTLVGYILLLAAAVMKHFTVWLTAVTAGGFVLYYAIFLLLAITTMKKEQICFRHNKKVFLLFPLWITVSAYYAVVTQFMHGMSWKQTKRYVTR